MIRWQYLTAEEKGGMLTIPGGEAAGHQQSLRGGLDYLGSQGWELVASLPRSALGTTTSHTLVFKRQASH